jgi:hypothetical protein
MFTVLSTAWALGSPFKKAKMIAIAVLALAVFSAVSYGVWRVHMAFQHEATDKVVIDAQKDKIKEQKTVIADQTVQAEKTEEGKKAEDVIIVKTDTSKKVVDKKTATTIEQVTQKVDDIKADVKLTSEEKGAQVAQVTIDTLWSSYCDAAGSSASGCASGTAPATTG